MLTRGDGEGLVVVVEGYDPGWRAFLVDGAKERELPVVRADGVLMAIATPLGKQTIDMRYRPRTWPTALAVAAIAALAWAAWLLP